MKSLTDKTPKVFPITIGLRPVTRDERSKTLGDGPQSVGVLRGTVDPTVNVFDVFILVDFFKLLLVKTNFSFVVT